jgi:hypothetical protein
MADVLLSSVLPSVVLESASAECSKAGISFCTVSNAIYCDSRAETVACLTPLLLIMLAMTSTGHHPAPETIRPQYKQSCHNITDVGLLNMSYATEQMKTFKSPNTSMSFILSKLGSLENTLELHYNHHQFSNQPLL